MWLAKQMKKPRETKLSRGQVAGGGQGARIQGDREYQDLAQGEVRLYSAGGAEILLKNTGEVVINGQTFDPA